MTHPTMLMLFAGDTAQAPPPVPVWFEIGSMAILLAILLFDLLYIIKRPHVPSMKEASIWVAVYVSLALVFAGVLFAIGDSEHAGQFLAGWVTEYSLSIDNLFVFVIILTQFAVPRELQQRALMVGIIVALVFRGVFILLGAHLIESFSWIFYIFGLLLVFTAWRQAFPGGHDEDEGAVTKFLKRRVNMSEHYDGGKLTTRINGRRFLTPLLVVFIALGATDLMFAIDSIPAIFGITKDPFLVFATNVFALMGLRQLYFLLGGLIDKLQYLHLGIAFILGFIGVKLIFHAMHENDVSWINGGEPFAWAPDIDTWTSLGVIIAAMALATIASLWKMRADAKAEGVELHFGAGHAEVGADGRYHLTDAVGNTFERPVRLTRDAAGALELVDAQGTPLATDDFERDSLAEVVREDLNTEQLQIVREELQRREDSDDSS